MTETFGVMEDDPPPDMDPKARRVSDVYYEVVPPEEPAPPS